MIEPSDRFVHVPRFVALFLAALTFTPLARAADRVLFEDDNFDASWTSFKLFDTTPGSSATFSSTTLPGGPYGLYRSTTHTFANGAIGVAHQSGLYTHSPATQPISSIDFVAHLSHLTAQTVFGAVRYQLLLQQGSAYYASQPIDVWSDQWTAYLVSSQPASSFTLVAGTGPAQPDFTCSGGTIAFGFLTSNSGTGLTTKSIGVDIWKVYLNLYEFTSSDLTFASGWTSVKVLDTTIGSSATTSSTTQPSGGFSGPYRETSHTYNSGAIVVSHTDPGSLYFPVADPIYTLDFSVQANHLTAGTIGGAVGLRAALIQGSAYYGGPTINVFNGSWTAYSQSGLVPSDFVLISGTGGAHPDFTISGGPITFGYMTSNSAGGGPVTKTIGVDNWSIRANRTPPCSGPVGIPICFGDEVSNPCPCISTIPPGSPGRGCPNSVHLGGATLIATGTPSLSNDSLLLQSGHMPNGFSQYIQGTLVTGNPFGDGRLCLGGTLTRLGVRQVLNDSSHYPGGPHLPVSVQGVISTPGQRLYQVWYRDAANFCTSATFNLSNVLVVNWLP
jgi:hypothetical protein